jgi:hypothetical protein
MYDAVYSSCIKHWVLCSRVKKDNSVARYTYYFARTFNNFVVLFLFYTRWAFCLCARVCWPTLVNRRRNIYCIFDIIIIIIVGMRFIIIIINLKYAR